MAVSRVDDVYATVDRLLGRTPDDVELQAFLKALGFWPLKPLPDDEFIMYLEAKKRGFSLVLQDVSVVKHPLAAGKPPGALIFVGCFFYAGGEEEYDAYDGALPRRITWSDNAKTLAGKMGAPENEINSKKTGKLMSHRWHAGNWLLTARYSGGGTALARLYLGIF